MRLLLLANTGGFGLLAQLGDLVSRQRGGKTFLTLEDGEHLLPPAPVAAAHQQRGLPVADGPPAGVRAD